MKFTFGTCQSYTYTMYSIFDCPYNLTYIYYYCNMHKPYFMTTFEYLDFVAMVTNFSNDATRFSNFQYQIQKLENLSFNLVYFQPASSWVPRNRKIRPLFRFGSRTILHLAFETKTNNSTWSLT